MMRVRLLPPTSTTTAAAPPQLHMVIATTSLCIVLASRLRLACLAGFGRRNASTSQARNKP